jgi:hypothetical protein
MLPLRIWPMQPQLLTKISSTAEMALSGGVRSVPLRPPSEGGSPFTDERHRRRFMAACHRAFEKAQDQIVSLLEGLEGEADDDDRERTELIIRKIADGIAVQMLQYQTHIMRRFCVHPRAPGLDMKTVRAALPEANRLNAESRQTFALLADLTTFIHVADILRLDGRDAGKLSLIELKSGKVNEVLLSALESYKPEPDAVKRIASDPAIQEGYKKQAMRMMNQKIRVRRAEEFLGKDEGIDPGLGVPIQLSGPMIYTRSFDSIIDQLCEAARKSGFGAGCVDWCVHIGAGYAPTPAEVRRLAFASLNHAIAAEAQNRPDGFAAVQQEVVAAVGGERDDNLRLIDLFANNLHSIATRPFLLWEIKRPHLVDLISGNVRLIAVFDLQKFFWLARREGVEVAFASRRESEEMKAKFGAINVLTWGHRAITYPYGEAKMFFTTGLFGRIINDLMRPLQLIREMLLPSGDKVAEFEAWGKKRGIGKPNAGEG